MSDVDQEGLDQLAIALQDLDIRQIRIAQTIFEWWWRVSNDGEYSPRWEKCYDHIQAFWMDGAWRVMNAARKPHQALIGWASAQTLQRMADSPDGTWTYAVSKNHSEYHPFPIYVENPPDE